MKTLAARDVEAVLEVVAELHDLDDPLAFPPHVLAMLRRLIPSDEVGYAEVDPSAEQWLVHVWQHVDGDEGVVLGDVDGWNEPSDRELWWQVRDSNPVCRYRSASGDWTTPCKVSDFATLREFRRTPIYDAFIRGGADYYLDVSLDATPMRHRSLGLWRLGRDFGERDRLVLALLRPHLATRARAVASATERDARDPRVDTLTARERAIIERAARGEQNDAIALELGIAPATVAKHLEHVYRKLGVANRTAAAAALHT